ncbi:MAG: 50S ribosomal protein L23 [Chlorobiota bacterium]|jgi:large subunit ribosomal protein L23|nr:50S ribosomal protein L23 [Chlorobiota bacterium]QQS65771.1 MAG: 50S ribosomal protein L23 [Chlorobiota bacterium]
MRKVLKRPILSEKNTKLNGMGKYTFEVVPSANKIEIKKAIEEMYNVKVESVNTITVKPKKKSIFTKAGVISGKTNWRKKAIITVAKGQTLDILGESV